MRVINGLIFKTLLSSMILTAPTMLAGNKKYEGSGTSMKEVLMPYYSSAVIKKFVHYTAITTAPVYRENKDLGVRMKTADLAASVELKMVLKEASILYNYMSLAQAGMDQKAFEYAWRGYHNLVKRGMIRRKNVLSICDFSQPSRNKRMYVIDVRHKRLLYRTFVAHGQNSGGEYADSFSNEPDSYKSSLGFYVTSRTYFGRNGLSLRIEGVDTGYNDMAGKRNIVLHGSAYVSPQYIQDFGAIGTSLGCPAIPSAISPRIIRTVKDGSCLFIYHPTKNYLSGSTVLNG
jgi:hypothetical protein